MTALFFVQAPIQILLTYEAIKHFNITNYYIIVRYSGNEENDFQIDLLLKLFKLEDFVIYKQKVKGDINKDLIYFYQFLKFLYKIKHISKKTFDYIFFPEFSSGFTKVIQKIFTKNNNTQIYFLDDGAVTPYIQKEIFSESFNKNLFTFFDQLEPYKNQVIEIHKFEHLKDFILKKIKTINVNNDIAIIGQPFYEGGITTMDENIFLIKKAISSINSYNQIIYIPHRRESKEKLEKIKNIKEGKIMLKKLFYPIELFPFFEPYIPGKIFSFYSTALFSLKKLYFPNIDISAFKYNYHIFDKRYINRIKLAYNMLKIEDINIINID